jgi:predicted Zn-dependent protease
VRGEQLFSDRKRVEVRRAVESDLVEIEVLCPDENDPAQCGAARATLNVGGDPSQAIEFAASAARRVRTPIYSLPAPGALPEVATLDPEIAAEPSACVAGLHDRLMRASGATRAARLTQAEWFAEAHEIHLVNSQGIDARQELSEVSLEWIILAGDGESRVDTTIELQRRRLADVDVEALWEQAAGQTADRHRAEAAPSYQGPVILRGEALAAFLNGGTIATLTSGRARFSRISPWVPGQNIFRGEVKGEPLTIWATRLLPYGEHAGRFDAEGLAGQRYLLIENNIFRAYSAGQRYATYLSVPATGAAADFEIPPGAAAEADLLAEPHVEVAWWSWFSPDSTTGDFASEIRLGYISDKDGRRPFVGGLLVGNLLEALADVRWSRETGFFGSYSGPSTARFGSLKVTPSR